MAVNQRVLSLPRCRFHIGSPVAEIDAEHGTLTMFQVESDKAKRGMVLTSTNKNIFCAGLDLLEMHNPEEQRLRAFWHTLQELWLRLYIFPKPTGAAIAGHSPAGGALMATCCDFRAMVASEKFTIGLNEAKFGLVAPFWFMDSFRNTVRNSIIMGQKSSIYPKNQILK